MFIRSGRGCPYKCSFCVEPKLSGGNIRYHSVSYMLRQIKAVNRLGIFRFMLWEEIATYDRKRMLSLCSAMRKSGLAERNRWACTTRVNHFDDELASEMKSAGCFMISFGIESADPEVLKRNRKGATVEEASKAIISARNHRIKTIGQFIIGLPGDDEETIMQTIRFAVKSRLDFAQFYSATPYAGSELAEIAKRNGWLKKSDPRRMDQAAVNISYPHLPTSRIESLRRKAFLRFYIRPHAFASLVSSSNLKTLVKAPLMARKFMRWII
jgi:radical SAM superfamily enzyme YgiQ (UPF0313 family)